MKRISQRAKYGLLLLLAFWLACGLRGAFAAEVMPPAPKAYFNDYAGVTNRETAQRLNRELEQFERDTSNQILVAIFPKMQSDSSIEDYTVRIAQAWHPGQKGKNNGAVLFVFVQDHKMFIQTGYGLEGALTDYLCNQIINNELKPRFRAGDFDGGFTAAVHAMIAATKGEYKGTGRTVAEQKGTTPSAQDDGFTGWIVALGAFFVIWIIVRGWRSSGGGPGGFSSGGPFLFGGGGFGDSNSGGGGSFGGGDSGGGGFCGGGGDFGGGGAGGSW